MISTIIRGDAHSECSTNSSAWPLRNPNGGLRPITSSPAGRCSATSTDPHAWRRKAVIRPIGEKMSNECAGSGCAAPLGRMSGANVFIPQQKSMKVSVGRKKGWTRSAMRSSTWWAVKWREKVVYW